MPPHTPVAPPTVLPAVVDALRADLRAARYLSEHVEELLGPVAAAALRREDAVPARRALRTITDPAGTLLGVFTLGATVTRERLDEVLPTLGAAGAERLGIVGPAGERADGDAAGGDAADGGTQRLRALIDLSPYAAEDDRGSVTWWIASDLSELATDAPLHPAHVLGVGGASLTLARITPRAEVGRVLDVGCGGGIQALHASRHAAHVVATDLSERALAFAAFNAALNGVELELRQGSLLEPAAGETFDLIVSNPPFVITPRAADEDRDAWTYRDGGRAGDALLGELLADLPAHLAPGGTAVMLGNWEITGAPETVAEDSQEGAPGSGSTEGRSAEDRSAWDAHPRAWLEAASAGGVDAWVIQREQEDPAEYAGTWARDGGITVRDPEWPALVGAWLDDFASRDVAAIGFGYVLLHRPAGAADGSSLVDGSGPADGASRRGVLRTESATGTGSGTLAEHLAASLAAIDGLEDLDDEALLAARPVRASDVMERRHLTPGEWDPVLIELVQGRGLARAVRADQALAATVGALDGTLTLGQVIAAVCALTDADVDETRERLLPIVRELVITGMVTL